MYTFSETKFDVESKYARSFLARVKILMFLVENV